MKSFRFISWVCATVALAGLVACGGDGGAGAASGGTAREFAREEGDVTVTPNVGVPTTYTATQVVTISNTDAGATRIVSAWQNTSGGITTSPSEIVVEGPGAMTVYEVQVTLSATAESEEQARALLTTMHIEHRDAVGGSTLYLDHEINFDQVSGSSIQRSAGIVAMLPATAGHELYQYLTSGTNTSSGLGGSLAHLKTTDGNSNLSGNWDDAVLETTSGNIDVAVASTAGAVYDVEGLASPSGTTTITVAGTTPVGEQTQGHKHYRSPDYSTGSPKIDVYGRVISGNIAIHN